MNDDTYMNDGGAMFDSQPEERNEDEKKERATIQSSAPVIPEILTHFDDRIAFYGSVDAIEINLNDDPIIHQKKVMVAQMMKQALQEEKSELEAKFESYL